MLTDQDIQKLTEAQRGVFTTKDDLKKLGDSLREVIKGNTQDLISHFNKSQGLQDERMDAQFSDVNTKLDAIMSGEILVTRRQVERLISALEAQGIKLNVCEILAA